MEAYGSQGQRKNQGSLAAKLEELGIDVKKLHVARGNKESHDFPPHVYLAMNLPGNTFRRVRISLDLLVLEDQTLVNGAPITAESTGGRLPQSPQTLDSYEERGSGRTERKMVRHTFKSRN